MKARGPDNGRSAPEVAAAGNDRLHKVISGVGGDELGGVFRIAARVRVGVGAPSWAVEAERKSHLQQAAIRRCRDWDFAHASRHRVGRSIVANVANLVSLRLGVEDAVILSSYFEPMFSPQDMMYLPNHVAVCRLLSHG